MEWNRLEFPVGLCVGQFGKLEVTNHKTKHKATLTFKTTDMLHRDLHKVEGFIYDARYSIALDVLPTVCAYMRT